MLVDDATVEVENIHRNHAMRKPLAVSILDGAHQIAMPALVGTLSICIVFSPVLMLKGVSKFLFKPLALAVVFAMLTSYLLSRTLVATMALNLLPEDPAEHGMGGRVGAWLAASSGASIASRNDTPRASKARCSIARWCSSACAVMFVVVAAYGSDRRGFLSVRRCGTD